MKNIKIKRVYETADPEDGYRVLVDRLWPRGLKKEIAALDEWNKDIAPSPELRSWFAHKLETFVRFSQLYKKELNSKDAELKRIGNIAKNNNLTLLYAAKNETINHVIVLQKLLREML